MGTICVGGEGQSRESLMQSYRSEAMRPGGRGSPRFRNEYSRQSLNDPHNMRQMQNNSRTGQALNATGSTMGTTGLGAGQLGFDPDMARQITKIPYFNGDFYEGEVLNDKRDG